MSGRNFSAWILLLFCLAAAAPGRAAAANPGVESAPLPALRTATRYHWEDRFSTPERMKLRTWVDEYIDALQSLVGELPFTLHVYLHRYDGGRGPVPWAQTQRSSRQGVRLYVNPGFAADKLRADWTAPHELSHLIIPYLGRRHSWFAEGFASYMQYQVMVAAGVITRAEADARYRHRFERAEGRYDMDDMPFTEAAPRLREQRQFPTMYWGGAIYFWQVEQALQAEGKNLVQVLRGYVGCCRSNTDELDALVADLDRVAGSRVFTDTLAEFRSSEGFPEFAD